MVTSARAALAAIIVLLVCTHSGRGQTALNDFKLLDTDSINSILGKLVGVQDCFKCSILNVVNNGRVRKLSEAIRKCMNAPPSRPFPPGWNTLYPSVYPYPGFFGSGLNPIWLQAFQAARQASIEATSTAVQTTTEAPPETDRPSTFGAKPDETTGRRKRRQAFGVYPSPLYPGSIPGQASATLAQASTASAAAGQRGIWGNQVDARIRCVLSELDLVGRDRELDSDALHKLIDGIVTDEQSKKRLTSISDACFKQSTKSSHSLTYYLTHPNQDSQETVYVKCILGKLDHACQKEYTDKYNPMKAEMLRLRQARCLLSDLRPDGQVLFKTISCVGDTFKKVSQAFASETRTASTTSALPPADTCRRAPFLFDPVVSLLKLPAAFSATAELLAVQEMVQCVLHELGVFASFAAPLSADAVTKLVDGMQGTILAKDRLKEASARCIAVTPSPKNQEELVGYINCVLDFLGDDCPNHSKDADNASFFEIIPTFLGERAPALNGSQIGLRPLTGSAALSTQPPPVTTPPPVSTSSNISTVGPPAPTAPPQPSERPLFLGDPFSASAGPFSAGFGSFGGLSGMPAGPSPLSGGLPPEMAGGPPLGPPLGFGSLSGLVMRVKRQRDGSRQPREESKTQDGNVGGERPTADGLADTTTSIRREVKKRGARTPERPQHRPASVTKHEEVSVRHPTRRAQRERERAPERVALGRVEIRPI